MPVNGAAKHPVEPFVVGATHRSSTVALRDRLFIDEAAAPELFQRLAAVGIAQAMVLSTCDRVEIQGVSDDPAAAVAAALDLFAARAGVPVTELAGQVDILTKDDAVRRIFAVAASLESQVIGEPQVLGQVKEGHRLATRHGMVGAEFDSLMQAAYGVAKRVRSETAIAERPVTLASSAVQVARDLHGDLTGCAGLLIGLGDMGDLIVGQLRLAGLGRVMLTGPSRRSEAEARRLGWNFTPFETLDAILADADIVVTAAGTGRYLVSAEAAAQALKQRKRRPVLVIDGGVPGDVDPEIDRLDGVFYYTLDDLERVAREGRANRETAAAAAWAIVAQGVAAWRRSRAERGAVPVLVALRRRFEAARREVLAADPTADAAEATRRLVNRLLHRPSEALRELSAETGEDKQDVDRMIARLFGLNRPAQEGDQDEDDEE